MPYIIALTGGICSGKNTVSEIFFKISNKTISIIDTDLISKKITAPGSAVLCTIRKHFGPEVLLPNGSLNRFFLKKKFF
ncbi:dephospho-CoA kinase [Candidatus Blochmannia ocreatus]|uniref:Dephospho-CoA kinase n=1 Tax=Candidatus Blochmannia ocreatus (nom. nud.) TaxID=251538 RepID=A0ABY4SW60_9ENTR|nr:dephospho-CoA kinase [Candidatus Blochmannia ocreatus]URJ25230.1 dephospho-CoA kinase [Candidatus Blochmannia ocreatus]